MSKNTLIAMMVVFIVFILPGIVMAWLAIFGHTFTEVQISAAATWSCENEVTMQGGNDE